MKNIRINVTKQDIKKGSKGNKKSCPIALACKRAGLKNVAVGGLVNCDSPRGKNEFGVQRRLTFKMPRKAHTFISLFDLGNKVKPFSFTLTT